MDANGYVDDEVASIALAWGTRSSATARAFIRQVLTTWALTAFGADAELCASEMTANALLHAAGDTVLVLRRTPDRLRIEVTDAHPRTAGLVHSADGAFDVPAHAEDLSPVGRGLAIVAAVSAAWGVNSAGSTKTIWAVIDLGQPVSDYRIEIEMVDVPVALALANAEFCENVLTRVQQGLSDGTFPAEVGKRFVAVMGDTARSRHAGRLEAKAAADAGMARYTARVTGGPADLANLQRLDQFLDSVRARLSDWRPGTGDSASERELRAFRQWVEVEARRQLQGGAPHPCPFPAPASSTAPPSA